MSNRNESRKVAYQFIVKQSEKMSFILDKVANDVNNISVSLDELIRLKEGLVDPSPELVRSLKKLLSGVVSGAEIDKYLVKPFQ